jgi:hypothetical protein
VGCGRRTLGERKGEIRYLKHFALSKVIAIAPAVAALAISSCTLFSKTVTTGGVVPLKTVARPRVPGRHVIIFALDGVSYDQLMTVLRSGKAPNIAGILGKERGDGVFEHGYSSPDAVSMLPSSTVADCRGGDIVLLAQSGAVPIEHRYYFAANTHYIWHGVPIKPTARCRWC